MRGGSATDAGVSVRPSGAPVTIRVEPGVSGAEIAGALAAAGVIGHEREFTILLEYTGAATELRAGRYEFARGTPASEVLRRMREGAVDEELLQIPEGMRLEEIGELLEAAGFATREQWAAALANPPRHPALSGLREGASLLGYLLPASYPRERVSTAEELVVAMLDALEAQLSAGLRTEIEAGELTLHGLLTLASIVEKEAVVADEQPQIAAVLLNRLAAGVALDVDPTVQFAAASRDSGARGWWPQIFEQDLEYDSLYNTYLYPDLPPGPIANPGIGAIIATLRPAESDYFYFVARCDGSDRHDFAVTLEAHSANVARCHGD